MKWLLFYLVIQILQMNGSLEGVARDVNNKSVLANAKDHSVHDALGVVWRPVLEKQGLEEQLRLSLSQLRRFVALVDVRAQLCQLSVGHGLRVVGATTADWAVVLTPPVLVSKCSQKKSMDNHVRISTMNVT